ncbi:MAG: flagellar hook-associated protein FlgK [Oscillospiraceae bacterium]|nr:flagellar hook-associated protein FlgK [Oscillospiraceae bacterium]
MRGTFFGLEIGRTGLNMGQLGLDITGHNIANVNTRGFTRQRIIQTANDPFGAIQMVKPAEQARVGGGTRVQIHDQIRSAFLDRRFRTENTANGYWERRTQELRSLESFFDNVEERTSINHSLARFFSAISVMAEDPVAPAPRMQIRTSALDMVQQFNTIHTGLVELQRNQDRAVVAYVELINESAAQLVELNRAIYSFELTGKIANDLRDQRNILLDDLSAIVDIEYEETSDKFGNANLTVRIIGNHERHFLVSHDERTIMGVREERRDIGLSPVNMPVWVGSARPNNETGRIVETMWEEDFRWDVNLAADKGLLRGLMDMRDGIDELRPGIPASIEHLNNLVRALVQHVNHIHRQGWSDHPFQDSRDGINFFCENAAIEFVDGVGGSLTWDARLSAWVDDTDNPTASFATQEAAEAAGFTANFDISRINITNIALSTEIMESEFNIAASSVQIIRDGPPENQQRGNNENMNAIYALFGRNNLFLETLDLENRIAIGSFDDFATGIRTAVASQTRTSRSNAEMTRNLALAAENHRLSVAGVSLDEEMTHMIKFNHAYNGAARVITAMDDALDRLINGTGRVGL